MAPRKSEWICKFYVEDPQRHPKGFTIYKLTSIVFPQSYPEAGTKIITWKRFNDFKRLYAITKQQCKNLSLEGPPNVSVGSFFNRFNEDVIKERLKVAQDLLNFIGHKKVLFLGEKFREFLNESYYGPDVMGQNESLSWEHRSDIRVDQNHWQWADDARWHSDGTESSDDESFGLSRESDGSVCSLPHNNNVQHSKQAAPSIVNNNTTSPIPENHVRHFLVQEESNEVLDVAGGGKGVADKTDEFDVDPEMEVVCHWEMPVTVADSWVSVPSSEQRLSAYRIVNILDPFLVVTHVSRPNLRLALKVLRKSCWPSTPSSPNQDTRPVPHMVKLIDYIETDDAVFVVTELVNGGRLWDRIKQQQKTSQDTGTDDKVYTPDTGLDADVLVKQAQRLLASVTRTLARSAEQHSQLKCAESALDGRQPRSKSVLNRPRLERRFSSGDATGPRPRTAHASLDRSSNRKGPLVSEEDVRGWAADVIAGLDALHTRGIVWRDLHHNNLLNGPDGRVLLTFQYKWSGVERPLHPLSLANHYVAPEVSSVFPVNSACDWWSVGVLLFEMLTGVALVEVHPNGISSHTLLDLPEFLSADAKSLLIGLLTFHPNDRLGSGAYGSEEIKCHGFFKNIDWEYIYNEH